MISPSRDRPAQFFWLLAILFTPCFFITLAMRAQADIAPLQSTRALSLKTGVRELLLDGDWQAGLDRHYDRVLRVPGLATDPSKATEGTLWYKRTVAIPTGQWTQATLTLKGARFAPRVYVNGQEVSKAEGGMAATVHRFSLPAGHSFTLEIALQSLKDLNTQDASAVPSADQWRNNDSSYLWDSVVLRLHGDGEIASVAPSSHSDTDSVSLHWTLNAPAPSGSTLNMQIFDERGKLLIETGGQAAQADHGVTNLALRHQLKQWSPEHPHLYRLRTELTVADRLVDAKEQSFGLREFAVKGLGFQLNGRPYSIRMGTVVWHRWTRDPEAKDIAFDPVWFENNVVLRLKRMGANALRFHLGLPPEALLDLCDRDGLAVQMEWPFFHGIGASQESMQVQWKAWLDTAMRHPSVVIVHPWNETGGPQLERARSVLDSLLTQYSPMVVAHRDLTPIHKYWWSLFENLGLYYDSAAQFGQAVMVDEFGGDYLDGNGDPGSYPTTRETFLRFLGRRHTKEERLELQAEANGRVAEYWRRLGVAGFSPFCILGSQQDGNHWFLGPTNVSAPKPKPVWSALSAAFAPESVGLELWNRNFAPGETVHTPLWFFNNGEREVVLKASIHVLDAASRKDVVPPIPYSASMPVQTSHSLQAAIPLPQRIGEWLIEARLDTAQSSVTGPVISSWHVRTFVPTVSSALQSTKIGVPKEEGELRLMLEQMHLNVVDPSDPSAKVILASRATWKNLRDRKPALQQFDELLHRGTSIVLLDAGPQPLGVGYKEGAGLGGPLEGAPNVSNPAMLEQTSLFNGIDITFVEVAEPESTLQEAADNQQLWSGIPHGATWLWNGLRGGLIVPASDMQVTGLNGSAISSIWQSRGADIEQMSQGSYFAYELAGYYSFASRANDRMASDALRKRVKFLVEDAPSLQDTVNPDAPIHVTDLGALFSHAAGKAESVIPLANAGKNLDRTPIVRISYNHDQGSVIISQLLTTGRLLHERQENGPGIYGLRYDPIAVQFVLNMLDAVIPSSYSFLHQRN